MKRVSMLLFVVLAFSSLAVAGKIYGSVSESGKPVAPGVKVNSIIAVKGDGPIETGADGVVKYSSAHIDGVETEFVVRSIKEVGWQNYSVDNARSPMAARFWPSVRCTLAFSASKGAELSSRMVLA